MIKAELDRNREWAAGVAISHELLSVTAGSSWPHLAKPHLSIDELSRRILKILNRPVVVLVVRAQPDFLESWYTQLIKAQHIDVGAASDTHAWWRSLLATSAPHAGATLLKYNQLYQKLMDCFGSDNVKIWLFEEIRQDMGAFGRQVTEFLGGDPDRAEGLITGSHYKPRNEAMPRRGAKIWGNPLGQRIRRALPRKFRNAMGEALAARPLQFDSGLRAEIRDCFQNDNAQLAMALNKDLWRHGY